MNHLIIHEFRVGLKVIVQAQVVDKIQMMMIFYCVQKQLADMILNKENKSESNKRKEYIKIIKIEILDLMDFLIEFLIKIWKKK